MAERRASCLDEDLVVFRRWDGHLIYFDSVGDLHTHH